MNHFLLNLLAGNVSGSIPGRRLRSIRHLSPIVSIELAGPDTSTHVVVFTATPGPFCYVSPGNPLGGAGDDVFTRARGAVVVDVGQDPQDRVLRLGLDVAGRTRTLAIYLHGSAGRVRLEGDGNIIESLDPDETGKPAPSRRGIEAPSYTLITRESLASAVKSVEAADALERVVPGLARELIECFTSGGVVDVEGIIRFRDDVRAGATRFDLGTAGRLGRVTPLPPVESHAGTPESCSARFGPFVRADEGCEHVGSVMCAVLHDAILERHRTPLRRHLAARRQLRDKLERQLGEAENFDAGRNEANILAAFQSRVPAGASQVELPDLYEPDRQVTIELDPSLSIEEQIARRYRRAAKLERSRETLRKRIAIVGEEMKRIDGLLAASARQPFETALATLRGGIHDHGLARGRRAPARPKDAAKRFRRYELDDQWFVLVGRNDRENEEITFRVAGPDDIWMHAQQVPGSHVVLKCRGNPGNPPDRILDAAAGVAGFYSKARHARLVPVIYTLRKYVRKIRGGKPGQVRCERERTIFSPPRLPDES